MRNSIRQLFQSALICLVCISFLTGSTYAWVVANESYMTEKDEEGNVIATAINPQLSWTEDLDGEWNSTIDPMTSAIFSYSNWEPGHMQVRYIRLENGNEFPLKYVLNIERHDKEPSADLARVIDVYFIPATKEQPLAEIVSRQQIEAMKPAGTLAELMLDNDGAAYGMLEAKKNGEHGKVEAAIVLHMREEAGNEYQGKFVGNDPNGFNLYIKFDQFNTERFTY